MGLKFEEIYNKTNKIDFSKEDINDSIEVSFLDVIKEKKITRKVLQKKDCLCISSNIVQNYYKQCPKCLGKKKINILDNEVTCNRCKGTGLIVSNPCPICNNLTYLLSKEEMSIKLEKSLLDNPYLTIKEKGINKGSLILKINVIDKEDYLIKNDDVYSKKVLFFKKEEFKKGKEVETVKDISVIKLDKIEYEQIIPLKGKGLNGKDFYQPVRCEVEGSKGKDIYSNLIIKEVYEGIYISKESLFNKDMVLKYKVFKPLNDQNYEYVKLDKNLKNYQIIKIPFLGENGINQGVNGDLYLKVFIGDYIIKDKTLYRIDEVLTKTEKTSFKKTIIIDNEKHLVNMEKDKEESYFLYMGKYGLIDNEKKAYDLFTLINNGKNTYKISTYPKGKKIYIEDYKHFFEEKVDSFLSKESLKDYLEIDVKNNTFYDKYGNKVIVSFLKKEAE